MNLSKIIFFLAFVLAVVIGLSHPSYATSRPVRIAIIAASSSGIEQELVDELTAQLQDDKNIVLSTVNPDWYVTCHIEDHTDTTALTVRVNGTVTIKTVADGCVLNTISAQTNKQDFSVSSGPTPVNRILVTSAIRQLIYGLLRRSVQPIEDAVVTEIDTREKINKGQELANTGKYGDAVAILSTITRDSSHFRQVQSMIVSYSRRTLAKNKTNRSSGSHAHANAQLKALEAQKHALDAQRQAIDAQENAIRSNGKP